MQRAGDRRVEPPRLWQQGHLAVELFLNHEGEVPEVRVEEDRGHHAAAEKDQEQGDPKTLKKNHQSIMSCRKIAATKEREVANWSEVLLVRE